MRQRQHHLPYLLQAIESSQIKPSDSALMLRIAQKIIVLFKYTGTGDTMLGFPSKVLQVVGLTVSSLHRPKTDRAQLTAHADVSHASLREPAQCRAVITASSLHHLAI